MRHGPDSFAVLAHPAAAPIWVRPKHRGLDLTLQRQRGVFHALRVRAQVGPASYLSHKHIIYTAS